MVTYPLNNVLYTAEDAELFHATRTSGIFAEDSFSYSLTGNDNTVVIGTGIGWIKNGEFSGKVCAQKEPVSVDMGLPDSVYPRIDAVVIRFDSNQNETMVVAKAGSAASNPLPPPVERSEEIYELHLYHIRREPGALSISYGSVTDLRTNKAFCGLMADSVTEIDTTGIERQISDLINRLREEIEDVESNSAFWLKTETISIPGGGTGARSEELARKNLGVAPATEDESNPGCFFRIIDGEIEWINPPGIVGVEYKTVERFTGKPVYTKTINFGELPNAARKSVAHGASAENVIRVHGTTTSGAALPTYYDESDRIEIYANKNNVYITTVVSFVTPAYATVQIWFTKP